MAIRQTRGDNRNRNTTGRVDNRRGEVDPKIVCFKCGQPGHRASHCNLRKSSPVGAVQAEGISSPATTSHQVSHGKPVACEEGRRPVTDGFVNGTPVKVLRDSGSTVVVVRSTLAPKRTGRFRLLKTIDSTMLKVATAMVQVDSPYFVGEVEANLSDHPLCDCVIGNIFGAKDPFSPDPAWKGAGRL